VYRIWEEGRGIQDQVGKISSVVFPKAANPAFLLKTEFTGYIFIVSEVSKEYRDL
jgi:hypothetical protein